MRITKLKLAGIKVNKSKISKLVPQNIPVQSTEKFKRDSIKFIKKDVNAILPENLYKAIEKQHDQYSIKKNHPYKYVLKRSMDYIGGVVGTIVTAPIILAASIAIKHDSPGPAIFKQVRIGQDGKPFIIYKLRTQINNAQKIKNTFQRGSDPRVTKAGKFLRESGIDELPQFWNVLKGNMSLVGPRPFIPAEVKELKPEQMLRYANKPGLAMLSTTYCKDTPEHLKSSMDKYRRFNHDEFVEVEKFFCENWSLKRDLKTFYYFLRDLVCRRHD